MQVGDIVKVLEPFAEAYPGKYKLEYVKADGTCGIAGDRDFADTFLEVVQTADKTAPPDPAVVGVCPICQKALKLADLDKTSVETNLAIAVAVDAAAAVEVTP